MICNDIPITRISATKSRILIYTYVCIIQRKNQYFDYCIYAILKRIERSIKTYGIM